MRATLSALGLYTMDNSIFDGLALPVGVEKQTVVDNIFLNCAELEVLYSNPETFKLAVKNWSELSQNSWARVQAALTAQYDPIENYNRQEDWTDTSRNESASQVAGYNGSDMANADRADASGSGTHSGRIHGNIGVTTNQQMIREELELRARGNIVDIIAEDFKQRFCLLVY